MKLRTRLGRISSLRVAREVCRTLSNQFGFGFRWVEGSIRLSGFAREYQRYKALNVGSPFTLRAREIFPCLTDRTATTPIEPTYFLQDSWCARKIAEKVPP